MRAAAARAVERARVAAARVAAEGMARAAAARAAEAEATAAYDAIQQLAIAEHTNVWALLAPELLHSLHPQRRAWLASGAAELPWTQRMHPSSVDLSAA